MRKHVARREFLFVLTLLVITITSVLVWQFNRKDGIYRPGVNGTHDRAVNTSRTLLEQQKKLKVDLSDRPCITNALMKGWVADLVHVPRVPEDDLPENQCMAFVEDKSIHFVELDLEGNVVRVK
jgi:hypothetical protein